MEYIRLMSIFCTLIAGATAFDKCVYEEVFCIQICCDSPEFHKVNVEKCEKTSKYFNISIHTQLQVFNGNHRYMNLLLKFWHDLSVPCLRSEDVIWSWTPKHMDPSELHPKVTPDYCFNRPSKKNDTKQYPLDCAIESTWYRYSRYVIIIGLIHSVLLLLSTIWIYSTINELKENIRLKLFIWYLTSLIMAHTSMIAYVNIMWYFYKGMSIVLLLIGFVSSYFFMSTFLCMNVIGFEIWITFRELSIEHILRNDKKRYMCYAIYVWGIPPIFYILYFLTLSSFWSFGPVVIILLCNFITFVYLTFKICTTRYNVANFREDRNPILDTCKILMGLFFMMGVPRIIFFVFLFLGNLAYYMISKYLFLCIESPLIFKLFVLKHNVWNLLKNKYRRIGYLQTITTTEDISSTI